MNWTEQTATGLRNVHRRTVRGSIDRAAVLLDSIDRPGNAIWPADRWPPLLLSAGQSVGSRGGHGQIHYSVDAVEPGRLVRFVFADDMPFSGSHQFEVSSSADDVEWVHTLTIEGGSAWTRHFVLPMHDALIEELLDSAQAAMAGQRVVRGRIAPGVRVRRWAAVQLRRRPETAAELVRRRPAADAAAVGLLAVAAIHAAWGLGSTFPARDAAHLSAAVISTGRLPGRAACFAVSGLLASAAGAVTLRVRPSASRVPFALTDITVKAAAVALSIRAVAGWLRSGILRRTPMPYRRLDVAGYSPLCQALAALIRRSYLTAR